MSVCLCLCLCAFQPKNNVSINFRLELNVVDMRNDQRSSTLGTCRSMSRSWLDLEIFINLPHYKLSNPISQL